MNNSQIQAWTRELESELDDILRFWSTRMPDEENGGFLAGILTSGEIDRTGPKGVVLNARILWSFSTLAIHYNRLAGDPESAAKAETCRRLAGRAFQYLVRFLRDPDHGGYYWSVDRKGLPFSDRKQIYAQAFVLYGYTEYYRLTGDPLVLELARELFDTIESRGSDPEAEGYVEAFNRDWSPLADLKLSDKDLNEPFSLNTHLHVLEAYTALNLIDPNPEVKNALIRLHALFHNKFLSLSGHLNLFYNRCWKPVGRLVSYGHDIEAAWLLLESTENTPGTPWHKIILKRTGIMVDAFLRDALLPDGTVRYESDPESGHNDTDRHWWVQAEAMVGLLWAWKNHRNGKYLETAWRIWRFIRDRMKDPLTGEWYWRLDQEGRWFPGDTIAGFWKCPYHNSRACLESIEILKSVLNQDHE